MGFLDHIAQEIEHAPHPMVDCLVVLPTQRGATYLKQRLAGNAAETKWLPRFTTLNKLTENLTNLSAADHTEMRFASYAAYTEVLGAEAQPISDFFGWCDLLLRDFNELESQLVDTDVFFKQLNQYTEIEHFSFLNEPLTERQVRYQEFWNRLPKIHKCYNQKMIEMGLGYPGLIAARASRANDIGSTLGAKHIIVAGFNAFSNAEIALLKKIESLALGKIYYDTDRHYMDQPNHHAGLFLKRNLAKKLGETIDTQISLEEKSIDIAIVESPHQIGQADAAAAILQGLTPEELAKTVLVLADENLLIPVLDALPDFIGSANITMGVPVRSSTFFSWVEAIFTVAQQRYIDGEKTMFRAVLINEFFGHPFTNQLSGNKEFAPPFKGNYSNDEALRELSNTKPQWLGACIDFWMAVPEKQLPALARLFEMVRDSLPKERSIAALQADLGCNEISRVTHQLTQYAKASLLDISVLKAIIMRSLLSAEVDLIGEPTDCLQIMGLLETRGLDFERVIFCSANEGVLPQKANLESFIPFEIKRVHGLAGRREKEAVYAYSFYRLLQHANTVHAIFDANDEGLNAGEKSRYLHQISYFLKAANPNLKLTEQHLQQGAHHFEVQIKEVAKSPDILEKIKKHIEGGISISSINLFLADKLEWYYRYILRLRQPETDGVDVAEFGTVVHGTLEELYKPFHLKLLDESIMQKIIEAKDRMLDEQFKHYLPNEEFEFGLNKIHLETARIMLHNYLHEEKRLIAKGEKVEYLDSELKLEKTVKLTLNGECIAARFKGFADRVERRNGQLMIVDYKTGSIKDADVTERKWTLESAAKKPKAVQLAVYNWMAADHYPDAQIDAQIISLPAPKKRNFKRSYSKGDTSENDAFHNFIEDVLRAMLDPEESLSKNMDYKYADYE